MNREGEPALAGGAAPGVAKSFVDHHPDPAEVQRSGEWSAGIAFTLGSDA
jgi:hypothetical protein